MRPPAGTRKVRIGEVKVGAVMLIAAGPSRPHTIHRRTVAEIAPTGRDPQEVMIRFAGKARSLRRHTFETAVIETAS